MQLRISRSGWRRASDYFHGVARRSRDLYPLADKIRQRWHESQRRVFRTEGASTGERWVSRAPSTLRRYRWPITHSKGGAPTYAIVSSRGVGRYTGLAEHSLTRPHQPGVKDTVSVGRGSLTAEFGIKPNGPIAHARLFESGAGSRPPRRLIFWDQQAHNDATADTQAHISRGDD